MHFDRDIPRFNTVFPADPSKANGTAVVICPGGAFFALSIDSDETPWGSP